MDFHVKLTEWLKNNRYTKCMFADMLGVSRPYFSSVCSGKYKPGKFLEEKIIRITNNFNGGKK